MKRLTPEEMKSRLEPVMKIFGPYKNKAVTVFEDCHCYPMEKVLELLKLTREIEGGNYTGEEAGLHEKVRRFADILGTLEKNEDVSEKIYLWPEGVLPVQTEYLDNSKYRYNHNSDFIPYMFEFTVPENVEPKGALIVCAGGDHGDAAVSEGYQVCMDFVQKGYQCFHLLNRPNHNPWSAKEAGVDAARAVRYVRANAAKYRISEDKVAYAGFSNGGLTGEGLIQYYSGHQTVKDTFPEYIEDELDQYNATPDAFLCIYGPRFKDSPFDYSRVVYPPTFFAVGRDDFAMENLHYVYPDLVAHNIPVEVHTFAGTPHGKAGVRLVDGQVNYPNFELWETLADYFMQDVYKNR